MIATVAAYTVFVVFSSLLVCVSIDHARQTRLTDWERAKQWERN